MDIILLLVGLLIGFSAAWFIAKFKFSQNQGFTLEQMEQKNTEILSLKDKFARIETENKFLQEKIAHNKTELDEQQKNMRQEFTVLANTLLEEKSKKFVELNEERVGNILNPLREKIKEFELKVEKTYMEETRERISLKEELKQVIKLNQQVSEDTNRLTSALKGDKKLQGDWGEVQLEMILEKTGLQEGIHFQKQQSLRNDSGDLLRPDFIINLPDNKNIILDSKVSLVAYENYFNTDNEESKAKLIKEHIDALHKHIKELSAKNYDQLYGINSPDYVLMFISLEPALSAAIKEDISLYEKALEKNIVMVSGSTLLATLRTISYIWKQENQKNNVVEIARQSGALYDKFVGFIDDMVKVGKDLDDSKKSYVDAMNKLTDSSKKGDTIVGRMEQIKKLGANASKSLPQNLIDRTE
jgi:DNA recombination protein RmuC